MAQYENNGDRLNILLADELPEDMTGTQDTKHICGKCAWYSFLKLESICRRTGKEVAYFANRECFTTDKDMDMEENNNAQPAAETGTQVCKECGRTLPLEDFQRRRKGNVDKVCKACRKEKIRIGIARKKEKKVDIPEKKPAESVDERIRQFLLRLAKRCSENSIDFIGEIKKGDVIAYLEKQKEPIDPFDTKLFQDGVKEGRRLEREDIEKEPIPIPDKFSGLKSLMLQYLQSAANRKDDTEIESDTDLWGRKILDYVWRYSEKQKEQKPEVISPVTYVADFSDAALLDELRRRGYKGRVSKCEEVEI